MDIALLSKMVKALLSWSDCVTLPGFGRFELEDVPASFSDKGFTINPPYKKVIFTPSVGEDNLLCESYAKANGVSVSRAKDLIMECVYGIVGDLKNSKQVEFPDFGRLKMTRGGTVLFVANQDLVLRPQFDMLTPISLKSLDLAVATEPVVETVAEQAAELVVEAEPVAEQVAEPVVEPRVETVADREPGTEQVVEAEHVAETEPVATPEAVQVDEPAPGTEATAGAAVTPISDPAPAEASASPETSSTPAETLAATAAPEALAATEAPETPVTLETPEPSVTPARTRSNAARVILITILTVVLLAALALGLLAVLGRVAPDFVDQFLYTPQELLILRTVI